jgi:hypothetical protein
MVLALQVVGIMFMVFMLYLTFLFYKRNNYGKKSFAIWVAVWLGGAFLLLFPQWFATVTEQLRFSRVTDFYIAMAIMFFGIVTFFNFVNVKRQERQVEKLVREFALEKKKRK